MREETEAQISLGGTHPTCTTQENSDSKCWVDTDQWESSNSGSGNSLHHFGKHDAAAHLDQRSPVQEFSSCGPGTQGPDRVHEVFEGITILFSHSRPTCVWRCVSDMTYDFATD